MSENTYKRVLQGNAVDLIDTLDFDIDLIVTDPPYAFGNAGIGEHEITALVATCLRESAKALKKGGWMLIASASSHRSMQYMRDSVRGIVTPVRSGIWVKPTSRTKVKTAGWQWASVVWQAFRKGKSEDSSPSGDWLDWVMAEPERHGRRAKLPSSVADWAVGPFASPGGIMLDPFCGSGVLLDAANRAGMHALGFDMDAAVCDAADGSEAA